MNACEEIRQSIDVNVPANVADEEWMRFSLVNQYFYSQGPDETEAEADSGFVHLEAVGSDTTRVTVDLNYCPHYQGISDPDEISQAQQHLRGTLVRYKEFLETQRV